MPNPYAISKESVSAKLDGKNQTLGIRDNTETDNLVCSR